VFQWQEQFMPYKNGPDLQLVSFSSLKEKKVLHQDNIQEQKKASFLSKKCSGVE
jgi:hypothetical protein